MTGHLNKLNLIFASITIISLLELSIHEAIPGHYVQLYYSNRCPSIVRSVFFGAVRWLKDGLSMQKD
jgi:hypothetical protein